MTPTDHDTTGTPYVDPETVMTPLPTSVPLQPRPIIPRSAPTPPNLTLAESGRLALLAEECGEVIQAIGKVLRHGYASVRPNDPLFASNRLKLMHEIGDVLAAVQLMQDAGDIDINVVNNAKWSKLKKVRQYLHHQPE